MSTNTKQDPGDALREILSQIRTDKRMVKNLIELAYTASERGILEFTIKEDSAALIIALVRLADNKEEDLRPYRM